MKAFVRVAIATLICVTTLSGTGCASQGRLAKVLRKPMEAVGLAAPQPEERMRSIEVQLFASDDLNIGRGDRGVAAVTRVYQLRAADRFNQTGHDTFLDEARTRDALDDDLLASEEVVMMPGTRRDLHLTLREDTAYLGVVTLYQAPAAQRWRFAFDISGNRTRAAGIRIGLHACAMSTDASALTTEVSGPPDSVQSVQCPSLTRIR